MKLQLKMVHEQWLGRNEIFILFFLIGIHSMQGWTATTMHWVIRRRRTRRRRSTNRLEHTENLLRKNLQLKGVCQF